MKKTKKELLDFNVTIDLRSNGRDWKTNAINRAQTSHNQLLILSTHSITWDFILDLFSLKAS